MQGQEKMSKSDPNSAIFMEDSEGDVNVKIKKAYCPPQVRHMLLRPLGLLIVVQISLENTELASIAAMSLAPNCCRPQYMYITITHSFTLLQP